jgi:hypothetical protein
MSLAARMVAAGLSAIQAQAIQGTTANSLTALGTTQGTALSLGADVNNVSTVTSGTGVIAPAMNPSDDILVHNGGANALLLYPPVGASINGLGANVGYSIAVATPLCFMFCVTPTLYLCSQSA